MATSNVDTVTAVIGRIPILDVQPAVDCGRRPAKSVAGETFPVSATVFREGHGAVAAAVVLRDPDGSNLPMEMMRELAPGSDRWGTDVAATRAGDWSFRVEAWSDPIADWHHDAGIKVPRGQDIELVMAEGDLVMLRGRFSGHGQPAPWIVVDTVRVRNGMLVEHWDVIEDEATKEASVSGLPMFGTTFPSG